MSHIVIIRVIHQSIGYSKNNHLTPQFAVNNKSMWFNDNLIHVQDNYFDTTVYIQQQFIVVQTKPIHHYISQVVV